MQCPTCRSEIEPGTRFCIRCGANLDTQPPREFHAPPPPPGGGPVYSGISQPPPPPGADIPPPVGGSPYGYGPPPPSGDYQAYAGAQPAPGPAPEFVIRPLGLGELFDAALKIYLKHFKLIFTATAVVGVPLAIVSALSQTVAANPQALIRNPAAMASTIVLSLLVSFVTIIGASIQKGATAKIVSDIYLSRPASLGQGYNAAFRKLGTLVLAAILYGIAYILGLFACIGPGIYLGVAMSLYVYAIMCEDKGIGESLSRSMDLIKGHWFKLFVVFFLLFVAAALIGSIPGALTGVLTPMAGPGNMPVIAPITTFISAMVNMFITPVWTITCILFYYDLRVRKEGFDLEIMAREIG